MFASKLAHGGQANSGQQTKGNGVDDEESARALEEQYEAARRAKARAEALKRAEAAGHAKKSAKAKAGMTWPSATEAQKQTAAAQARAIAEEAARLERKAAEAARLAQEEAALREQQNQPKPKSSNSGLMTNARLAAQAQAIADMRAKYKAQKEAEELAAAQAQEDAKEEAEERIHVLEHTPWHRIRAQQKKASRERAQARKDAKADAIRQNRIDRGLPVPPLPTEEELEEKKKAKEALSAKLKGRTKRTAVEQLLGSGSLHSYNEQTIVGQDAQLLPNAYDWTWRQKQFRPEERFTDRLDRMIGRMVDEDNDRLQEQLSQSRKDYAEQRKKELLAASQKGGPSLAKAMRINSSFATGGGRTLRSGKKTRFADDSDTDSDEGRTPQPIRSRPRPLDTQTLASDIALFMDRDDEPAAMIRGLNGYFDDEKVDAAEVIDLLVDKMDESEDENDEDSEDEIEEPYDPSDLESLTDPADEPDYDVTEALDPADDALLNDYYAAEWLDLMLEDSVNDIFAKASSRAGSSSGAEFDLLRRRVFNEIQQEFATRLWLEDEQAWGKAKPMSLAPFEDEFGPSFGRTLEAATSGVRRGPFAKMARISNKKKYRPNRPGRRPGVDVSGPMDLFNNNDVAPPDDSDTEPSSSESESESESSGSEDEVIVVGTGEEKQKKDTEDLLKAIQAALLKGGGEDIDEAAMQQLRSELGPDWKRRFTDVFRESNGQKGGATKTKPQRRNIRHQARTKNLTRGRFTSPDPSPKKGTKTEVKKPAKTEEKKPTKTEKKAVKTEEKKPVKTEDKKPTKKEEEEEDEKEEDEKEEDEKEEDDDDEDDSSDDSEDDSSDDDDEVKEVPSPYKTDPAFQFVQLDPNKSGSGRSWNPTKPRSRQTRPRRWDKSTQPGLGQTQAREVNKDLDMDAQGYHAQAEKNERDWADQRRKLDRQSHHRTSNDRVMRPDHYYGYETRNVTVPSKLRKGEYIPVHVDPQDAYMMSKAKPDSLEWPETQTETDGVDPRLDAHDGDEIEVDDDDEEEEEEEEVVTASVPAKRARARRGPGPARSVKRRKIDDAQRLIDEIAALEASIWDPASLPRYAPSAYPLPELLEQYGRIAAAFDRLSSGADVDDAGGFWSLQREKIQYISAALSYRGALERGDDVLPDFGGFGSSASTSAYSTDEESEVAAQLEGAHEYRLGTDMRGMNVPRPIVSAAKRAVQPVKPSREARMRSVARKFSTGV